MKQFAIITEADARMLDYGTTVQLTKGGHITPLAQDTLRERRVTVVTDLAATDAEAFVPKADVRTVAIGSDHSGLALKRALIDRLRGRGLTVHDLGNTSEDAQPASLTATHQVAVLITP